MQHEIELKLAIPEDALARWRRASLFRPFTKGRASNKHLVGTYFDTPELELKALGIALRVRKIGRKRIQTLKVPGNKATGFQHLIEYEQEISQDEPDLSLIDSKPLQKLFTKKQVHDRLTPVFTTEIKRRITILAYGESEIEMALDEGSISTADQTMRLSEAEFELRSGHPIDILDLALEIHGKLPFSLERRSKSKRGYSLFTGDTPAPARATPVILDGKAISRRVFSQIAWNCIAQMRDNEQPVLETNDPEGVHQLRVGIRRLRSLFGIYSAYLAPGTRETVVAELAWAQKELGPARDWDVFVEETLAAVEKDMPDEKSLPHLARAAAAMRASKSGDARAFVRSERYALLLLRLFKGLEADSFFADEDKAVRKALAKPVHDLAASVLARHERRVRKLASRVQELEIEDVHRLRLRVKKMRYAAEFFRGLFAVKKAKRRSKALAALQEALGAVNDAAVCEDLLEQLTTAAPRNVNLRVAAALLRGWYGALSAHSVASLASLWEDYEATPCFWDD
ncbi:CYTH and CHAD domain-containing protein [Denitrobaculum tricleocarpae]|uniref:CHAD domain-containing protein n=1 Tax=Denitrobaculum tricleocarpae TaxID=2591009 RepID=A0A545TM54_9PROT|nr:CYTH and CHAD domain-containing protein [Denitrobaculum tricleocarpae]TQV78327.1 CHAD domain-containing protein [Denitrobaculum tricleocarpae]